ncbi:MAG TPA: hypothetical protein VJI15_03035 [Candidatus Nanoarchaeia archaeon]|nr:hypothetical protein [Candidatus Nanoarchaeia archaeon]
MTIDPVVGRIADGRNLLENLSLLADVATWQTSQEVWKAWQDGAPIEGVNTANLAVYRLVEGEAVVDILGREGNPFVDPRLREDVYHGIVRNQFFVPQGEMKEHVVSAIRARQSATIRYSGLHLRNDYSSSTYGYIQAGVENTTEEKKLFSAVYGTDIPCDGIFLSLFKENIVQEQLQNRSEDIFVRACYFGYLQTFNAGDRFINNNRSAIRGVRREVLVPK